eukprot:1161585-Pelagomonas_calceolata.AAC.10
MSKQSERGHDFETGVQERYPSHLSSAINKCSVTEALGQKDQVRAGGWMPLWHLHIPILRNGWTCTTSFWLPAHSTRYDVILLLHDIVSTAKTHLCCRI